MMAFDLPPLEKLQEIFSCDPLIGTLTWKISPSNNVPKGARAVA